MRHAHHIALLGLAMAGSAAALAAPPLQLQVVGVIRPGACLPSFSADAQVKFGTITSNAFKNRSRLALPAQQFRFSIACDTRMRVGVSPHDNQRHSADRGVGGELAEDDTGKPEDIFGLGSDSGRDLGGYEARFVPGTFQADGRPVDTISTLNGGNTWTRRRGGQITDRVINSWAERGTLTPAAFANLSGMLRIRAVINALEDIRQDANLDGSLTLELHYL